MRSYRCHSTILAGILSFLCLLLFHFPARAFDAYWNFNQLFNPAPGKVQSASITALFSYSTDGTNVFIGAQTNRFFTDTNNVAVRSNLLAGAAYRVTVFPSGDQVYGNHPISFTNYFPSTLTNGQFVNAGAAQYLTNAPFSLIGISHFVLPGANITLTTNNPGTLLETITVSSTGGGGGGSATNAYQLQVSGAGLVLSTNALSFLYTLSLNANLNNWANRSTNAFTTTEQAAAIASAATNGYPWGPLYDPAGAWKQSTNNPLNDFAARGTNQFAAVPSAFTPGNFVSFGGRSNVLSDSLYSFNSFDPNGAAFGSTNNIGIQSQLAAFRNTNTLAGTNFGTTTVPGLLGVDGTTITVNNGIASAQTGGSGDVKGAASSTDATFALFQGTSGKIITNRTASGTFGPSSFDAAGTAAQRVSTNGGISYSETLSYPVITMLNAGTNVLSQISGGFITSTGETFTWDGSKWTNNSDPSTYILKNPSPTPHFELDDSENGTTATNNSASDPTASYTATSPSFNPPPVLAFFTNTIILQNNTIAMGGGSTTLQTQPAFTALQNTNASFPILKQKIQNGSTITTFGNNIQDVQTANSDQFIIYAGNIGSAGDFINYQRGPTTGLGLISDPLNGAIVFEEGISTILNGSATNSHVFLHDPIGNSGPNFFEYTNNTSFNALRISANVVNAVGTFSNAGNASINGTLTNFGDVYLKVQLPPSGQTNVLMIDSTGHVLTNDLRNFAQTNQLLSTTNLSVLTNGAQYAQFGGNSNLAPTLNGSGWTNLQHPESVLAPTSNATNYTVDFAATRKQRIHTANTNVNITFANLATNKEVDLYVSAFTSSVPATVTFPAHIVQNHFISLTITNGQAGYFHLDVWDGTDPTNVVVTGGDYYQRQ